MNQSGFEYSNNLGVTLGAEGVCLAVILVLLIALLSESRIKRPEHNYFVYTVLEGTYYDSNDGRAMLTVAIEDGAQDEKCKDCVFEK